MTTPPTDTAGAGALFDDMHEPPGTPIRIEGLDTLEEGWARKFLYDVAGQDYPAELVVCRLKGKLYAAASECPHAGGRLAEGPLWEERYFHCPLHLYRFEPKDGSSVGIDCPPAETYPIVEDEDGTARVWVSAPAE